MNKIQEWIRHCQESHPECRVVENVAPARLLDLQSPGPEGICLVEGVKSSEYIALSHCVSHLGDLME